MAEKIPDNALIVVADGTGARLFRDSGRRGAGGHGSHAVAVDGRGGSGHQRLWNPQTRHASGVLAGWPGHGYRSIKPGVESVCLLRSSLSDRP